MAGWNNNREKRAGITMNLKTKLTAILVLALLAMLTFSVVVYAAAEMGWSG
jgi:hypothetical protein